MVNQQPEYSNPSNALNSIVPQKTTICTTSSLTQGQSKCGSTKRQKRRKAVSEMNPLNIAFDGCYDSDIEPWDRFKEPVPNVQKIVDGLDAIPDDWVLIPVAEKKPMGKDWQLTTDSDKDDIRARLLQKSEYTKKDGEKYYSYASGYGVLTGDVSDGLLLTDIDGASARPILQYLSNGELPKTVEHTSGKKGRKQVAYRIPDEYRAVLSGFKKLVLKSIVTDTGETIQCEGDEQLEFRYNGQQSILPPSRHPDTGEYSWINSPDDIEVAEAPQWVIDLCLEEANREKTEAQSAPQLFAKTDVLVEDWNGEVDPVQYLNDALAGLSVGQVFSYGHNWYADSVDSYRGESVYRNSNSGTSFTATNSNGRWTFYDFSAGEGGGVFQYWHLMQYKQHGTPKGDDFWEAVAHFCDILGIDPRIFAKKKSDKPTPAELKYDAYLQSEEGRKEQAQRDFYDSEAFAKIEDQRRIQQWVNAKKDCGFERWKMSRKFTGAITINVKKVSHGVPTEGHNPRAIIAIKSGLGSGKSFWMRLMIQHWDLGSFIIGYRNLLGSQTIAELKKYKIKALHIHNDAEAFKANISDEKATLFFCVDSLLKFKGQEKLFANRAIIFDELMSFRKHLLYSKHIKASVRSQCLSVLSKVLKICGNIILLDGHLSDNGVNWIHRLAGTDRIVVKYYNEKPPSPVNIQWYVGTAKDGYTGEPTLSDDTTEAEGIDFNDTSAILAALYNDGGNIYVFSDNKTELTAIHKKLVEKDPSVARLLITADTSSDQAVKDFLENPTVEIEKHRYKSVLVSPSGDSGLDIPVEGYFQSQYTIIYGVIDASSAMQGTFRVRDYKVPRYIFVKAINGEKRDDSYDVQAHKEIAIAQFKAQLDLFYNEETAKENTDFDYAALIEKTLESYNTPNGQAANETAVQTQYETSYARRCFLHLLREAGHNIEFIVRDRDDDIKTVIKDSVKEIKEEKCELIFNCELPLDAEINVLNSKLIRTPEEQAQLIKASINNRLPGILDSDVFTTKFINRILYKNKNLLPELRRLYFAQNPEQGKDISAKKLAQTLKTLAKTGELVNTDVDTSYMRLTTLIDAGFYKLYKLDKWSVKSAEVRNIITAMNTVDFQRKMGIKLSKQKNGSYIAKKYNDKTAMIQIKEWLDWMGIKVKVVERVQDNNDRANYYSLDEAFYNNPEVTAIMECYKAKYAAPTIAENEVIPFGESAKLRIQENKQLDLLSELFVPIAA